MKQNDYLTISDIVPGIPEELTAELYYYNLYAQDEHHGGFEETEASYEKGNIRFHIIRNDCMDSLNPIASRFFDKDNPKDMELFNELKNAIFYFVLIENGDNLENLDVYPYVFRDAEKAKKQLLSYLKLS